MPQHKFYDDKTYAAVLEDYNPADIPGKIEYFNKNLKDKKVKEDEVEVPPTFEALDKLKEDEKHFQAQYDNAKRAVELPFIHPVLRAMLIMLSEAGIIPEDKQPALFEAARPMVKHEMEEEFARIEAKLRDEHFKKNYMDEVQRRVLLEKCAEKYTELAAKPELTKGERTLYLEAQACLLLDGNLDKLDEYYAKIHPSKAPVKK